MVNTDIYIPPTDAVWVVPKIITKDVAYFDHGSHVEKELHINLMQLSELQLITLSNQAIHFTNYKLIAPKRSTAIAYKIERFENDKFIRKRKTILFRDGADCEIFKEIITDIKTFLDHEINILHQWENVEIFRKK